MAPPRRTCTRCGRWRKESEFYKRRVTSRHCISCEREARFQRLYGLGAGQRDSMDRTQGGLCAICGDPPGEKHVLHLDHDHATGVARELLCRSCNLLLGRAKDSPEILQAALRYLKKHAPPPPTPQLELL